MKNTFAGLLGLVTVASVFTVTPSQAALIVVMEQPTPGNVAGGSIVPINVVLRGTRASDINTVQLTLSPLTGGATFSTATVADGFDESALTGLLSNRIDGSLVDNLTLAYGKSTSGTDTGIPAGSADLRIGTFYLQTPAGAGSYPLSFSSSEFSDPFFDLVDVNPVGALVVATVPEPAGLVIASFGAAGLLLRRIRRSPCVKLVAFA